MTHRPAGALALLVLLGACVDQAVTDRDGHDGYTGPHDIQAVDRSCTPGDADAWWFRVETEGWAEHVDVRVVAPATPEVVETHPLANVDYDPAGAWDSWEVTLLAVDQSADAQAGATTGWHCDDAPDLAWQAVMYAPEAPDQPADCVVWGAQASLALSGPSGLSCACVDDAGGCSP